MDSERTEDVWRYLEAAESEGTEELANDLAPDPSPETRRVLHDDGVVEDESGDDVWIATMEPEEAAPELAAMHIAREGEEEPSEEGY